jgi:hypothetical protein
MFLVKSNIEKLKKKKLLFDVHVNLIFDISPKADAKQVS